VKEVAARLEEYGTPFDVYFVDEGPPCPKGPCETCETWCNTRQHTSDGVLESEVESFPGRRCLMAIAGNRVVAFAHVRFGLDVRSTVEKLESKIRAAGGQPGQPRLRSL
jgi:hypothetical protein